MSALDLFVGTVLPRIVTITLLITGGVYLANLSIAFGAIRKLAAVSRPVTEPANLPTEVGTAILATSVSPTAGYSMLAEFRESGMLDDRATLVAVTINTFFGFASHLLNFYVPVLIPILGMKVGIMYVGARALIALAITLTGIVGGLVLLTDRNVDPDARPEGLDTPEEEGLSVAGKLRSAAETTYGTLRGIVPRLAVVYTVVVFLTTYYDLQALTALADPLAAAIGLPGASVSVIAVFAVDTTSGAVFIAPLIEDGIFTARQAVATMLVGGIVTFAVSTFKRSIPFQYSIWGAEFGSKVIAVNTVLKIAFISLALVLLLVPV